VYVPASRAERLLGCRRKGKRFEELKVLMQTGRYR
jgi:hypothetical protein